MTPFVKVRIAIKTATARSLTGSFSHFFTTVSRVVFANPVRSISSANAQTMPVLVAAQNSTRGPEWWYMSVLILIMILPVIVMAVILERFISRGILTGAVKG